MHTRRRTALTLSSFAICAAAFAADITPLNVKPGAWEVTIRTSTQGLSIPAGMLTQIPPAQREKIAASMRARAGKVNTQIDKECITAQELQQEQAFAGEQEQDCKRTVISSSPTRQQIQISCRGEHPHSGTMTVNATTPSIVTSVADIDLAGSGQVHVDTTGRWLGTSCAGIGN